MKHPAVLASIIVSVSLLGCSLIVGFALKSLGTSIEAAAPHEQRIPDTFTVRTPDMNSMNVRLSNGGGGGESFRVETHVTDGK